MKFIDEAKIFLKSGHGGPGLVSWRREKFVPRGGPNGGDGGAGGNVIFKANRQLSTLLDFKFKKRFIAEDGNPGEQQNMTGHTGKDAILEVPKGTIIKNALTGAVICDMSGDENTFLLCKGGRGGKGNQFFKNSVNQAPKYAQPGEPGEELEVFLELKLIADVGIIGFPNAGKSTLISRISAAKPKIADYPFTTLVPNLGVVQGPDLTSFVVADIPGLIKGAHLGAGLGIRFLKHIERTRFFIHLVDASQFTGRDPMRDFKDINDELKFYDEAKKTEEGFFELSTRAQLVVLNKIDLIPEKDLKVLEGKFKKKGIKVLKISGATGDGIKNLINEMTRWLSEENRKEEDIKESSIKAKQTLRKKEKFSKTKAQSPNP
jgi:GTP-binding protein